MIYFQPITFYAIVRDMPGPDRTEIAEHKDGAMKAYAERRQAEAALSRMDNDGWTIGEILMVPPLGVSAAGITKRTKGRVPDLPKDAA